MKLIIYIILIVFLIFALIITYFLKRKHKPNFYRDLTEDTIRYGQSQTFKSEDNKLMFKVKSRGFKN
jgi:hypothetical protein